MHALFREGYKISQNNDDEQARGIYNGLLIRIH